MAERICVGFVNLPGAEGEEWGEPEMQPYMAVIEGLQERLVCEGRGVTLEVFVELPHGVGASDGEGVCTWKTK